MIYALEDFEEYLKDLSAEELDQAVGKQVAFPVGEEGFEILTAQQVGRFQIGLETVMRCQVCGGQPETYYICRGAPGWCYVFKKDGEFVADLRNQSYYCDEHAKKIIIIVMPGGDSGDSKYHRPPSGRNLERLN